MKIIGIVSEYNPFHSGHAYQIETSKKNLAADGVVAIMSGNFVQRGFPAIYDKWFRAELAVRSGANLVIELPTYYATASAESFARGAIELLDATGVISHLSFGSESNQLNLLDEIASVLLSPSAKFQEHLRYGLDQGLSFPAARSHALLNELPHLNSSINLNQSNIILGIEYLKALKAIESKIEPYIVKRIGNDYHESELSQTYASATAIRKAILTSDETLKEPEHLPLGSLDRIRQHPYPAMTMTQFETALLYQIRKSRPEGLSHYRDVSEGLENKIYRAAIESTDYDQLVNQLKSKRYALTRINRILLNILLEIKADSKAYDIRTNGYIRVLAFDEIGQKIIRKMKKESSIPIITNLNKFKDFYSNNELLLLDIKASDLYQLGFPASHRQGGRDFLEKPFHFKL